MTTASESMMVEWVAETQLCATSPRRSRVDLTVRFAKPVERDGSWWCRLQIAGLDLKSEYVALLTASTADTALHEYSGGVTEGEVAGDDSLQAITLAIAFAGKSLAAFVAAGGRLEYADGGMFPIELHFPLARSNSR